MGNDSVTTDVTVSLTADQRTCLVTKAKAAGLPLAAYLRQAAIAFEETREPGEGEEAVQVVMRSGDVERVREKAREANLGLGAYVRNTLLSLMRVPEEMCYITFEGVPQVFYGPSLDQAQAQASFEAERTCGTWSVLSVPKVAVEIALAAVWQGVRVTTLANARAQLDAKYELR